MQKKKCHAICVCKVRLIIHIKCNQLLKKIKQKLLNEKKNNMIIESLLGFRIKSVVFKNWLSYHIEVDFGVHKEYLYNHNTTSRTNARVHTLASHCDWDKEWKVSANQPCGYGNRKMVFCCRWRKGVMFCPLSLFCL